MALQYDKINLLWVFFGSGNLLFRAKKARKFKIWTLFARSKKIQHFLGGLFWKHNSILDQTLHGPSVSHNRAPVKVFWFKQFTFQRIERNEIWNLDPFSPLERNWPIFFFFGFICKAGFSFGPNFPWPFLLQNKTPVKVFGWRNLLFRKKKAIKY